MTTFRCSRPTSPRSALPRHWINDLTTLASKYGHWYQYFNGLDITLSLRAQNGLTFQGGTSTGQTVADACDVIPSLPEFVSNIGAGLVTSALRPSTTGQTATTPVSPYCHVAYGVLTQLRGLASYDIPKIDAQFSAVFQ